MFSHKNRVGLCEHNLVLRNSCTYICTCQNIKVSNIVQSVALSFYIIFLQEGAVMRDAILAIRADEAHHRVVNHTLSSMHLNEKNPFSPGQKKL